MAIANSLRQNKLSDGSQGEKLGGFCSVLRKGKNDDRKTKGSNSADRKKYRELRKCGHVIEEIVIVAHACYPSIQEAVLGFNQFKASLSYSVRPCLKTKQKYL